MIQSNWARYWRNALADASSCQGILREKEIKQHHSLANAVFGRGVLISSTDQEDEKILDKILIQKLFVGEDEETSIVKCQYRPVVYVLQKSHNTTYQGGLPQFFSPIVCPVWITRNGLLYPAGDPNIPRDLLSPQAEDKFTIATMKTHDDFLTRNTVKLLSEEEVIAEATTTSDEGAETQAKYWEDFYELSRQLFSKVCCKQEGWTEITEQYLEKENALLIKTEQGANFAHSILKLYDEVLNKKTVPLFDNYAVETNEKYQMCPDTAQTISLRLGHSNSDFPLADAQRDALSATLQMQAGEILPVNGPPGTGKTTFVLSAVASLWVQAALEDDEPPLVIAASTNNQAVTNVIDAFGKDFGEGEGSFGGRWLPDINSYGGYFPSDSKKREAAKNYQTLAFYEQLEEPTYLDVAEAQFCEKAALAFPELQSVTLDSIKNQLLHELVQLQNQLTLFEKAWQNLAETNKFLASTVGKNPTTEIARLTSEIAKAHDQYDQAKDSKRKWQHYLADESVWLSLCSWLPSVARKKAIRRKLYIDESFSPLAQTIVKNDDSIEKSLTAWQRQQQQTIEDKQKRLEKWQQCDTDQVKAEAEWKHLAITFAETHSELPSLDEVDKKLDTGIRYKMFRLAVHFWEARWLIACRAEGEKLVSNRKKTGKKSVMPRWRRRMMLTPCIVSTFHSLPKHMTYTSMGDNGFETHPLCNEVDLLIVDEAGQVSPEVAGASFALAKKALVIGDIHQIEPVRSLTPSIDIGNLLQCDLIQDDDGYEAILNSGRSVTNGSVMHIAQQASRYHYQTSAEPGMFLREHRRCYDEIISYCNDLCYNGLLIAKRGNAAKDLLYPAFGYLHIDGRAESPASGSRCNPFEAETLAAWLNSQRGEIEQAYGESLEKVVGVVTPFTAQVREIETACEQYDIQTGKADEQLTVGTVHSLQGAERKIVIFSQVYSRHSDGEFIDMSNTMLNVAVSRAKDCFLVFGDMDVVKATEETKPRGLLAKYLFEHDSNEILFPLHKRSDLLTLCSEPKLINNAAEHDAYLTELLDRISHSIYIVSPWVIYDKMVTTGLLSKLVETVDRGVSVNIFTDRHFNTTTANRLDQQKLEKSEKCWQLLRDKGMNVYVINGVHSKLIMADDKYMSVGSFNWLSAAREGKYANMEASLVYYGDVTEETKIHLEFLNAKIYKEYSCKQNQSRPIADTPA